MKNDIINFFLFLLSGPAHIQLNSLGYIILFISSILVGKFLGEKRYIGFTWSTIFFFLMPLLGSLGIIFSLTIIFLSPKLTSKPPKGTSGKLYWGVGLLFFSILAILGIITSKTNPINPQKYLENGSILLSIELILLSTYLIWIYLKFPAKDAVT